MLGDGFDDCKYDYYLDKQNRILNKSFVDAATLEFNNDGLLGDFDKCDKYADSVKA